VKRPLVGESCGDGGGNKNPLGKRRVGTSSRTDVVPEGSGDQRGTLVK